MRHWYVTHTHTHTHTHIHTLHTQEDAALHAYNLANWRVKILDAQIARQNRVKVLLGDATAVPPPAPAPAVTAQVRMCMYMCICACTCTIAFVHVHV